jgi:cyclic pyranopterin phosphate synthase
MVDVSAKPEVYREAKAKGLIRLKPETLKLIQKGKVEKGDVFSVAKVAGILAAKNTCNLIPLCHPLPLTNVQLDLKTVDEGVEVEAAVKTKAQTGVEMEALVAVSVALLAVWDMTKQYEKDRFGQYPSTIIESVYVISKVKKRA